MLQKNKTYNTDSEQEEEEEEEYLAENSNDNDGKEISPASLQSFQYNMINMKGVLVLHHETLDKLVFANVLLRACQRTLISVQAFHVVFLQMVHLMWKLFLLFSRDEAIDLNWTHLNGLNWNWNSPSL